MYMDVPNNPIPNLESRHSFSDLVHDAGDVAAEYGGVLRDEDAEVLHMRVERIDGDCGVFDDDLAWACSGDGGGTDAEGGACGVEEGGEVRHDYCESWQRLVIKSLFFDCR